MTGRPWPSSSDDGGNRSSWKTALYLILTLIFSVGFAIWVFVTGKVFNKTPHHPYDTISK